MLIRRSDSKPYFRLPSDQNLTFVAPSPPPLTRESTTKASFDFWTNGKEQEAAAQGRQGPRETTKQAGDYFAQVPLKANLACAVPFF